MLLWVEIETIDKWPTKFEAHILMIISLNLCNCYILAFQHKFSKKIQWAFLEATPPTGYAYDYHYKITASKFLIYFFIGSHIMSFAGGSKAHTNNAQLFNLDHDLTLYGNGHYLALNSVWSSVIGNALNMYVSSWSVNCWIAILSIQVLICHTLCQIP